MPGIDITLPADSVLRFSERLRLHAALAGRVVLNRAEALEIMRLVEMTEAGADESRREARESDVWRRRAEGWRRVACAWRAAALVGLAAVLLLLLGDVLSWLV